MEVSNSACHTLIRPLWRLSALCSAVEVWLCLRSRYLRLVTEDTGIVDQDIDTTPLVNGLLDDLGTLGVGVVVGDGLTTGLSDLLNDDIGSLLALVISRRTEIVDENLGTARREEESVSAMIKKRRESK